MDVPVSESDDCELVVNIVSAAMRVIRVIHDHSTAKTITVLGYWGELSSHSHQVFKNTSELTVMRVVPESPGLLRCRELIQEGISRGNGTLRNSCWTIGPGRVFLEEAVPMLRGN